MPNFIEVVRENCIQNNKIFSVCNYILGEYSDTVTRSKKLRM